MWEIRLNGGLGQRWPIPNRRNKGEGDDDYINIKYYY